MLCIDTEEKAFKQNTTPALSFGYKEKNYSNAQIQKDAMLKAEERRCLTDAHAASLLWLRLGLQNLS